MDLTILGLAFKSGDRSDDVPMTVTLIRELPGSDRPDYWLGVLAQPLHWVSDSEGSFEVSHVVVASQWEGTRVQDGVARLPVGVAYVVDPSLLDDDRLDLEKIRYVATGVADDTTPGREPLASPAAFGFIASLFRKRNGE